MGDDRVVTFIGEDGPALCTGSTRWGVRLVVGVQPVQPHRSVGCGGDVADLRSQLAARTCGMWVSEIGRTRSVLDQGGVVSTASGHRQA